MKIAIDISQVAFTGTGVATYTEKIVDKLVKQKEHEFLLFGYSWGRRQVLDTFLNKHRNLPNVGIKLIPAFHTLMNWWGNTVHLGQIEKPIGNFDILHTSDSIEFPSRKIKVTTIHDLVIFHFPQYLHPKILSMQKQRLTHVVKESSLVFADSEATKKDIIRYLNIPEARIKTVYLGVDERYHKRPEMEIQNVRHKYKLPENYLLFVGTREPRKNLQRLLEAFKISDLPKTELVIIGGKGWGEDLLIGKNVRVLDIVNGEDLPAIYSGAAAFIYPSLYEGFGLPVLEAMRCEVPVVTSNRGSLSEISNLSIKIDPDNTGSIVHGLEQVQNLSADKREQMIKENLHWTQKFNWDKSAEHIMSWYKKIAKC